MWSKYAAHPDRHRVTDTYAARRDCGQQQRMSGVVADVLRQRGSGRNELYLEPACGLVGNFDFDFHLNYGGQRGWRYFRDGQ